MDYLQMFNEKWWRPSGIEVILIIFLFFVVPFLIAFSIMVYRKLTSKRIHDHQLFLFRLKRLGMTNFQIKIVNNLAGILRLTDPNRLLDNAALFETAVGRFLTHVRASSENTESLIQICRDITLLFDKLYLRKQYRKPISGIGELDENQLVYFTAAADDVFLGKIVSRGRRELQIALFSPPDELRAIPDGAELAFTVNRTGDADYRFVSRITSQNGTTIGVAIPDSFERGEESRHPYIDVIINASLSLTDSPEGMEEEKTGCTIYKLNEYEAILRTSGRLDYNKEYFLEFSTYDFNFRITAKIISGKIIKEETSAYYTLKFSEMSESSSRVLRKYLQDHL